MGSLPSNDEKNYVNTRSNCLIGMTVLKKHDLTYCLRGDNIRGEKEFFKAEMKTTGAMIVPFGCNLFEQIPHLSAHFKFSKRG